MKLSKQERIAAIVVVVLIVLVAGVFLFIKPNIETISATKATLAAKEKEYNDAVAKAAKKDGLKTQILEAYDKGKNLADMFFPELAAYESDNEFREFLSTCESNVMVESLKVSNPSTANLSTSIFTSPEVQYALKEYVNQGGSDEVTDPRLIRQAAIKVALGDAQTIGASTVSFRLLATTYDDLLSFADEVNRYQKTENGKSIRKAIELSNITFKDSKTTDEYKDLSKSILAKAESAAAGVFKDKNGVDLKGHSTNGSTQTPTEDADNNTGTGEDDENEDNNLDHYFYSMDCTITFYSIVRMQDPTPTLNEQDSANA